MAAIFVNLPKYLYMRLFILLMFSNLTSIGQSANPSWQADAIAGMERDAHARIGRAARGTNASNNFDVSYYRCEWKIDPAIRYIGGNVTIYFRTTANTNSITLDLSDALITDSVKQHGSQLMFSRPADALTDHPQ